MNISVENGVLTVRGERKLEEGAKQENFLRMERSYGRFSYLCAASTVDTEHINASYVKAVLTIELTKKAEAKPKKIPISVGQKALGAGATAKAA